MIKFIDKLIDETQQGVLDYVWEYYGDDRFKYVADKHPLKDLNFSLKDKVIKPHKKDNGKIEDKEDVDHAQIIFPNGASLEVDRSSLETLNTECKSAIIRAMENTACRYADGTIQAEIEAARVKAEADAQKKKQELKLNQKSKEIPANEQQENKPKV
jgi:hypothetical protein